MQIITEKKSERISARLTPTQRRLFARAAEVTGMEMTEFVIANAQRAAEEALQAYAGPIRLAVEDQVKMLDALNNPKPMNAALRDAFREHDATVDSQ